MNWVSFPCCVSELLQPQLHCCLNRFEGKRGSPCQHGLLLTHGPGRAALRSSLHQAAAPASAVPQTGGAAQAGAAFWGLGVPEPASRHLWCSGTWLLPWRECSEQALVPPAADGIWGCRESSFQQILLNHADWKLRQHPEPPATKATARQCGSLILPCPLDLPELERVTCVCFCRVRNRV